jgi:hypothetical protein
VNTILADAENAILERAITADNESWSPEAARAILAFRLADADMRRADELAAKARGGAITDEDRQQLENYLRVGRLVEFMKAKALLSLKTLDAAA